MAAKQQREGRKQRPTLERVDSGESKFARALGSVDYHTREAGLQALTTWLSRRHDIAEFDLLRLWKGVFYCFWHSDKSAVQTALAERLSEIMTQLPEEIGWLYYQTFVRTLRREWSGIDRLRLDKFMMLIRKFFAQLLRQMQAHAWEARRVQRVCDYWLQEVLVPQDTLASAGVAYHLTDLLLSELAAFVREGGEAPDDATLRMLLDPFCRALATTRDPALVYRLKQGVFDSLVAEMRQPGEASGLQHLDYAAFATHLFALGAQPETRARNREALYAVSTALEKTAAKRQRRLEQQGQQPHQQQRQAGKKAQQREEQQAAAGPAPTDAEAQQQGVAAEQQQQQEAAAAEKLPASGKKGKKRQQAGADGTAAATAATTPVRQPQQVAAAPSGQAQGTPPSAMLAAAAGPPPTSGKKKKSRLAPAEAVQLQAAARKQQQDAAAASAEEEEQRQGSRQQQPHEVPEQEQQLLAAAVAAAVAGGDGSGFGTPGSSPSKKKNVRFSLRRNLVNVIGQPPKPADVRTPPTAKPKGSALKKDSLVGGPASAPERLLTRAGVNRMAALQSHLSGQPAAPASASRQETGSGSASAAGSRGGSSKKQQQKQKRRTSLPAPGSFSRPRASEFF